MKLKLDLREPPPEPTPPPGGWQKPSCTFASHSWTLEVEDGRASIRCVDPCDSALFHPASHTSTCLHDWQPEDFFTVDPIPVALTYVDDSTPSTPAGPAEYGYYIEIRPEAAAESREQE